MVAGAAESQRAPRKDSTRRVLQRKAIAGYEDSWDLLASAPQHAPFLGDPWYLDVIADERWCPPHPPSAMLG